MADLKEELAVLEKEKAEAKEEVINHLRSQGYTSVKRAGKNIVLQERTYSRVIDFDALSDWVDEQEEPRSEYMKEVFREDVFNEMVREVRRAYPGQETKYLPPGLSFYSVMVVSVRKAAKPKKSNAIGDRLKQMAGGK